MIFFHALNFALLSGSTNMARLKLLAENHLKLKQCNVCSPMHYTLALVLANHG